MSRQTETTYQYIKEKILDGTFKPTQKLTETQLAQQIAVSRNTVKKALLKLEQENLVTIEDNKGATIKSFTLEEVINYLEIREVLEGLVARSAARSIDSESLAKLKGTLDQMKRFLDSNELDKYSGQNKEFHAIIYQSASNQQAVEIITVIRTQLIRYHFRTILVPGRKDTSLAEHMAIYEALRRHDEDEAERTVKRHIASVRDTIEQNYRFLV
ncbi:GntR family transcriptional regulator [Acetonema longum]|uniref:GntR family transcriptional regulator n=1 Tax=Acetonema longum DSM 6540 TaxID=1009370 RepID=F7NJU6_9FIRM|nr:GntR family transcriptional regulator [Acetonema longum]EGO63678.1 GntR family transcriptional regulator [Acetonema longum DSM 6540]